MNNKGLQKPLIIKTQLEQDRRKNGKKRKIVFPSEADSRSVFNSSFDPKTININRIGYNIEFFFSKTSESKITNFNNTA